MSDMSSSSSLNNEIQNLLEAQDEIIDELIENIDDLNKWKAILEDVNADELAKFRFKICQDLLKYSQKENLNAAQMAKFLGIPKSDMSRIFNHRIDRFSTDKLVRLFAKIKPNFQLKVA